MGFGTLNPSCNQLSFAFLGDFERCELSRRHMPFDCRLDEIPKASRLDRV